VFLSFLFWISHSIFPVITAVPKLPIYSASFLGTSGNVVVSGRRSFFYIYDAVAGKIDHVPRIIGREEKSLERCVPSPDGRTLAFCGNDGYIILFDVHNKHWIADLKMNGSVRAITFTPDGEQLVASGSDGDVYRWDLKSRQCIERFSNEDGTITAALAASSRHLAVGAESGVVNLYSERVTSRDPFGKPTPSLVSRKNPVKSIMNLHTSADMVRLNHDGQILAMSSRREKMGMKLLHVPSGTVFSNWPTSKTPLNYVWSMDFSPQSRFLAVGNDQGKCLLYRLMHYQD
jgi:U3 small nucleolar RNA-associated protein 18